MASAADLEAAIDAAIARGGPDNDDPAPYLVYADWLQQHGDPRGELIAIQHARELADTPELAAHEQARFEAHLADWLGAADAPYRAGELELAWRRGFIRSARVRKFDPQSPADPIAILRALASRPAARFVVRLTLELASFRTPWADIADAVTATLPNPFVNIELGPAGDAPASLQIVAIPPSGRIEGYEVGARVALPRGRQFVIGRSTECDLVCYAPGLGGRRNSVIRVRSERWMLHHMQHSLPISVNGHEGYNDVVLCHGDCIEPAPGLVLRFTVE